MRSKQKSKKASIDDDKLAVTDAITSIERRRLNAAEEVFCAAMVLRYFLATNKKDTKELDILIEELRMIEHGNGN